MNGALYFPEFECTVRWQDIGTGDPILFLPGLSMPVLPEFVAVIADPRLSDRRKILIDYPGAGASDHPLNFDYDLSSHANVILAVLDSLDLASVDVVGHSMGGTVGIQIALQRANVIRRLLVAEGNIAPGGGAMSLKIAENGRTPFLSGGFEALIEELKVKILKGTSRLDRLIAAWRVADPSGIYGNARALIDVSPDFLDAFGALGMPRAFIYGSQGYDHAPTPDAPDPQELEARGIVPYVVPEAGHAMMHDNHDDFVDILVRALKL